MPSTTEKRARPAVRAAVDLLMGRAFVCKEGFSMTNKMWGGRFQSGPDAIMEEINASIGFDRRLYAQDIRGSKAHAAMLPKQAIISKVYARDISSELDQVQARLETVKVTFPRA